MPLINEHLLSLMAGTPTSLPRYSFMTGTREAGPTVTLGPRDVIIIEGIHGLNPKLVPALPASAVYRIYVSAITQLNLDRHNRVSISDTRLVRRIVRDAATRGYRAAQTLGRWDSVQRGERLHIFPFTENSDAIFNSSLVHELSVLRPFAEPLLLQVRPDTPEYARGQPGAVVPSVVPAGASAGGARQLNPARVHRRIDSRELSVGAHGVVGSRQ